jgi:hypothetical protein
MRFVEKLRLYGGELYSSFSPDLAIAFKVGRG